MDPREAEVVLREARAWAAEGLLPAASLATVESRYAPVAARATPEDERLATLALYGVGGALLGAAAIALVVFLELDGAVVPYSFLALAAAFTAAGFAVSIGMRNESLADALFVAGLVSTGAMAGSGAEWVPFLSPLGLVAAPILLGLRRERRLVPFVAALEFYVGAVATLTAYDLVAEVASTTFLVLAAAWLAFVFGFGRMIAARWRAEALAVATIGLTPGVVMFTLEVLALDFRGAAELVLGAVMIGVLWAGIASKEKGMVVGAAAVIAVDAIVYAFDIGGVITGVGVLVATAAVMLWQGERIRKFVRAPLDAPPPPAPPG